MGYCATGYGAIKLLKKDMDKCAAEIESALKVQMIDIYDAINYVGFDYCDNDGEGNIVNMYFDSKYRDDEITKVMIILAKYTDGYVEFDGEDNAHWKFILRGGISKRCDGVILYLDDPEERKYLREKLRGYDDE